MFVDLDQQARLITLEGMQARYEGLQALMTRSELSRISEATREAVIALFADHGVTSGQPAAYGRRHAQAIEQWLDAHPAWDATYAELKRTFDALSAAIEPLPAARR